MIYGSNEVMNMKNENNFPSYFQKASSLHSPIKVEGHYRDKNIQKIGLG